MKSWPKTKTIVIDVTVVSCHVLIHNKLFSRPVSLKSLLLLHPDGCGFPRYAFSIFLVPFSSLLLCSCVCCLQWLCSGLFYISCSLSYVYVPFLVTSIRNIFMIFVCIRLRIKAIKANHKNSNRRNSIWICRKKLFLNKIYEPYIACNQTMLLEDHNLKDEI